MDKGQAIGWRDSTGRAGLALLAVWAGASLVLAPPLPLPGAGPSYPGLSLEAALALAVLGRYRGRRARALLTFLLLSLSLLVLADRVARAGLGRAFNPVLDLPLAPALAEVAGDALGGGAIPVLAAILGGLALAFWWALGRAASVLSRPAGRVAFGGLAVAAIACCGIQWALPAGFWRPVTFEPARTVVAQARGTAATLARMGAFRRALEGDPYRDAVPVFAGLGGADVVVIFVESYGMSAIDDPELSPPIRSRLSDFAARAGRAGVFQLSGQLVSPTVGGQSWLAHATLLGGIEIRDDLSYRLLLAGDRPSLVHLFGRAGYRTAGVMPAITRPWPEGALMGFDALYPAAAMGYAGPPWYWGTVPDQFALAFLERQERQGGARAPLFAVVALISSHAPWTPVPEVVAWADLGDGSVFGRFVGRGRPAEVVWRDPVAIRAAYVQAVSYSLETLSAWAERFVDRRTLAIIVGDHQPAPVVTGAGAPATVPIHVLSGDEGLLAPFRERGFVAGMLPRGGPVLTMAAFRDLLLDAYDAGVVEAAGAFDD
jgi:hypothetical protein